MGSYLLLQSTGEEKRPSGGDEGKNISCDNERFDMRGMDRRAEGLERFLRY